MSASWPSAAISVELLALPTWVKSPGFSGASGVVFSASLSVWLGVSELARRAPRSAAARRYTPFPGKSGVHESALMKWRCCLVAYQGPLA
jgi:hypothetical protein